MQPMLTIALRAARKAGEIIARSVEQLDKVRVDENPRIISSPKSIAHRKKKLFFTSKKRIPITHFSARKAARAALPTPNIAGLSTARRHYQLHSRHPAFRGVDRVRISRPARTRRRTRSDSSRGIHREPRSRAHRSTVVASVSASAKASTAR